MGNMWENNAGARGEGDKNTKEVKERKKEMIVCVVFEWSLLILFWLRACNDIKYLATFFSFKAWTFGVVCLYLSLILILAPQCCICNNKGKNEATSPSFKHSRVNASSELGSWYGTSPRHANCWATLHSRIHQLSPNWDYALSWKLRFVVSNDLHKIMFTSCSVEYFFKFLLVFIHILHSTCFNPSVFLSAWSHSCVLLLYVLFSYVLRVSPMYGCSYRYYCSIKIKQYFSDHSDVKMNTKIKDKL